MCTTTRKRLEGAGPGLRRGAIAASLLLAAGTVMGSGYGKSYGYGKAASQSEIAAWDIDAMPDGRGLPPGSGDYEEGKRVYEAKCAACHGVDLQGVKGTGGAALVGGRGTIGSGSPKKTVESYWPYATTLFDYTKRAMPFNAPGSLSDDEVYAVSAYILAEGDVIDKDAVMDASTLPEVKMPNRDGFVPDPRPDVRNYD